MRTNFLKPALALLTFSFYLLPAFGQSPEKMSYQAVIRNSNNQLVANQSLGMQISILQGSAGGTTVYVERQFPTTNSNGLVSLEIGVGTVVSGTFTSINWANGPYFVKTETDLNGGANYTITGTSQLLSVPYALHAKTAETVTGVINETDPVFSAWGKDYNDLTNKPTLFDGQYNSLTGLPTLFSGSYNDLTNKPNLFSGSFADLTNKPTTLAGYAITDAFSGNYIDLTNKPTLFDGQYNSLTGLPTLFSGSYNDLTNKPNLFSGSFADLTNKPTTLAGYGITDAFSGNYIDLTNKPANATTTTDGFMSNADKTKLDGLQNADGSETKIIAGANVNITGSGTIADPYIVTATGGGASLLPPTATTQAASNIQITSATLNGTVNANGLSSTVVFEWGTTTAYGNTITATQSPVTGVTDVAVNAIITNLTGNTTYHYRIKATNAVDVTYSSNNSFTTSFPLIPTVTTSNFSDVKGNSAKAGGSITNNGGSTVTAQGLCWSTSPNPTIANSTTTSFTATMTSLSPNTVYYVRAYATNIAGTGYGNEISFNSGRIMGSLHAGGLVFYNDGAGGGLVCAETDQSTGAQWGCTNTTIGGTSTAINTGSANTNAIVAGCTTAGIAAKLCYDLSLNTYTDWYLPSKDELFLMYVNLHTQSLGGFASAGYWSSTEGNATYASSFYFNYGLADYASKTYTYSVRAVRAF